MLIALMAVLITVTLAGIGTYAYFSDTETSTGNTFAAGSLDLTVNGQDDPIGMKFSASNMVPGQTYNGGIITLTNVGTIPGVLSVKVSNPASNENGEIEPELSSGDIVAAEVDPTGYDANSGDGELWDMCAITIYFDINSDGIMQWNEPTVVVAEHLDMTSYFSIPLDTNLWVPNHGFDGVLNSGGLVDLGVLVKFKTDAALASQPQYIGLNNNMAMTDDMSFDLVLGLEQIIP